MLKNAARDGKELPEIVSTCGVKIDRQLFNNVLF